MRSSSSCWTRTTEVTIAMPSAAGAQPCATHCRCASRMGSRSLLLIGGQPRRVPLASGAGRAGGLVTNRYANQQAVMTAWEML